MANEEIDWKAKYENLETTIKGILDIAEGRGEWSQYLEDISDAVETNS